MNGEATIKRSVISGAGLALLSVLNAFTTCFNALFFAIHKGFIGAEVPCAHSPRLMMVQNMVQ